MCLKTFSRNMSVAFLLIVLAAASVFAQDPSSVQSFDTGEVTLSYELSGTGEPLVLIHGYTHNKRTWNLQMDSFSEHFRVLRYDRRGWGASSGAADVSADPKDLALLLDHLDISSAYILGHSQGGHVALRFAMSYPDKVDRLVLYGAPPPAGFGIPWDGPDSFPSNMPQIAQNHGLDSVGTILFSHPLARGFEEGSPGARLASEMWASYDGADLLNPKQPSGATPAPMAEDLSTITSPTLVIVGEWEMDYFQLVGEAYDYSIPNSERVTVSGGGHAVHLQQPERFNAEILRFLKKETSR